MLYRVSPGIWPGNKKYFHSKNDTPQTDKHEKYCNMLRYFKYQSNFKKFCGGLSAFHAAKTLSLGIFKAGYLFRLLFAWSGTNYQKTNRVPMATLNIIPIVYTIIKNRKFLCKNLNKLLKNLKNRETRHLCFIKFLDSFKFPWLTHTGKCVFEHFPCKYAPTVEHLYV